MCRELRFAIAKGEMLFILIYIHLSNLSTFFPVSDTAYAAEVRSK